MIPDFGIVQLCVMCYVSGYQDFHKFYEYTYDEIL